MGCQDTPCDKDPDSSLCLTSLERCKYDPDSGVMCQPKSPNDPCEDCLCYVDNCFDKKYSAYGVDSGNSAYLALTSMIVLAAVLKQAKFLIKLVVYMSIYRVLPCFLFWCEGQFFSFSDFTATNLSGRNDFSLI